MNIKPDNEQRPLKDYYLLSILIHVVLIASVFAVNSFYVQKTQETVTVILNNETFVTGASGEDNKSPGSKSVKKNEKRISSQAKVKKHHRTPAAAKTKETDNTTELKETGNYITSNETSDLALHGKPSTASADFDNGESNTGIGSGKGTGGHGSGPGSGGKGAGGSGHSEEYKKVLYIREHFRYIRDLIIKNLTYPSTAKKMGWKGQVTVSFIICEKGTVENVRIVKSSGHEILDENVENTIRKVQPFPKPPVRAEIVIPIIYSLG